MQIIKTDKGYISGTIIGEPGKEVSIFRGIPYAAPPVGKLRWKPPQPNEPWDGIRECTQFSAISPQPVMPGQPSAFMQSEDCLYLNVVTPAKKSDEKLPVMVWLHGGGYTMGCGNDKMWNYHRLPQYSVVVVTLNHRLGTLGLMAHPGLSKESSKGVSGNYLFLDIIASLKWIQNNIAAFGGDPDNITIFGESGGGGKVSVMMTSPLAKGLFHRAICESGTATAFFPGRTLERMQNNGVELFKRLGVGPVGDPIEQARQIPFKKIVEVSQAMEPPMNTSEGPKPVWDAVVDGWVLPDIPMQVFKSGTFNAVPFIACANQGELTGPGMLVMPWIIPAYANIIESVSKHGYNGYACVFDQVPSQWRKEGCVSVHAIELPYVFGDWDDSTDWWISLYMQVQQIGVKTVEPGLDTTDRRISEAIMSLWAGFAKTGKPQAEGIPEWPAYTATNDKYMYVNKTLEIKTGFSKFGK